MKIKWLVADVTAVGSERVGMGRLAYGRNRCTYIFVAEVVNFQREV